MVGMTKGDKVDDGIPGRWLAALLIGLVVFGLILFVVGPVFAHHKDGHNPPGQEKQEATTDPRFDPDKGETGGNGLGNSGSEPDDNGTGPERDNPVDETDADGNNGNGNDSDRCDDDEGNNPQCESRSPSPSPSPSQSPSPSVSVSPSPSPSPSESPSKPSTRTASPVPESPTESLPPGGLTPETGSDVPIGLILAVGIGLLLLGAAALRFASTKGRS